VADLDSNGALLVKEDCLLLLLLLVLLVSALILLLSVVLFHRMLTPRGCDSGDKDDANNNDEECDPRSGCNASDDHDARFVLARGDERARPMQVNNNDGHVRIFRSCQ